MNINIQTNLVVNYKPCIKCSERLSKINGAFCKDCKPKRENNRALSKSLSKAYLSKFNANNYLYCNKNVKVVNISGSKFVYSKFRLNKEISRKTNIKTSAFFFSLYWDQFSSFDDFSGFIIKSGRVSFLYFMYNSITIQQKPKYKQFIISKEDQIPIILTTIQLVPVPILRPLLLLSQPSYWDELITSYFKYIHPMLPIFSIHSFNPKTAAKPLLSAVYYGGFQYMQNKPPELVKYFNEYAECNIKEAIRVISLQNAQATVIYSFMMVLSGNFKLFRACQAHALRMCYALGLHLNLKILTPLQRYDRMIFFFMSCAVHIFFYVMGDLSLNQLTELGDCNKELMSSKYQIPNSKCVFSFDTEGENVIYGVCVDISFAIVHMQSRHIFDLSKCSRNLINYKFGMLLIISAQRYAESISVYDLLLQKYPYLKLTIKTHRINSVILYCIGNLEMYAMLRHKVNKLTSSQISKMLDECIILFDAIIESQEFYQITSTYPYIAGLNFISIYQIANLDEKLLIKQKLNELFDYLSKAPIVDKLSYLIIKKEYESILKSK